MLVTVNGKEIEVDRDVKCLNHLVRLYNLKAEYVVAEVNGEIVERDKWETFELQPGLNIELVHFVGGG